MLTTVKNNFLRPITIVDSSNTDLNSAWMGMGLRSIFDVSTINEVTDIVGRSPHAARGFSLSRMNVCGDRTVWFRGIIISTSTSVMIEV